MSEVPACIHRWRLSSPDGDPVVHGRCSFCHVERDFPASGYDIKYQSWNKNLPLSQYSPDNVLDAYSLQRALGDR